MRSDQLLRKFGWKQSKGKWLASGHSRPLSLAQAKQALARDLKSKDFDSLKKSGKLANAENLLAKDFTFAKGKFVAPKGRKPLTLDEANKRALKSVESDRRSRNKLLGFANEPQRKRVSNFTKDNIDLYQRFVDSYEETQGTINSQTGALIARLLYKFKKGRTKRERQEALEELLILVGYRSGFEPWPAGQTPRATK